ncbi:MAG: serine--tRNA ligase [Acidimicrobiia bacterium]|nr:serine--tRNA ligase [Acidimicrobiia bacterium]
MIDLRLLRDDEDYRRRAISKGASVELIDQVLAADAANREARSLTESLRADANAASKEIGRAAPEARQAKIDAAGELKAKLTAAEDSLTATEARLRELALGVPNPAHDSVPEGDEDDFRVETVVGETSPPPPFDHGELGEKLGLVDTKRAVRMSGSRFAYVLGDAVRLQFALIQWTLAKLTAHGFVPVVTPVLVREEMMELAGFFPTDRNQVYELANDDLFLIGTAEVGLAGLHREEQIKVEELPLRYVGYSSCFRREAGTYGKDTSGLFRLHQFDKVEMFVYCHPDQSWEELELLRRLQEEIVGELGLPYRVITVASGDLGASAAKKYDLEVWLPSEQRYREITSCSNYTDYSARRMSTRVKTDAGNVLAHTLNGTATAIGRTLLYIMENHQQPDGTVVVPDVLRPYCGEMEVMGQSADPT